MSNDQRIEVTFKIPKGRTVTYAGEQMKDGQKRKVTPHDKEWLAERGLITAQPSGKGKGGE